MNPFLFPPVWLACYWAGIVAGLVRSPLLTHHVGTLRLNPGVGRSNVIQMRGATCCKPSCQ